MTRLDKPVFRVTRGEYVTLYVKKPRQIVVGLERDEITFRELGRRKEATYSIGIHDVFSMLVRQRALAERREKRRSK